MKPIASIAVFTLLLSACSFTPEDSGLDAKFHPPLTYSHWDSHSYTTHAGENVCAISSGYNGIVVTTGRGDNGLETVVASNRLMRPGSTLTVTVGEKHFMTYDTYFKPDKGDELVAALTNAAKAYLEWSEFSGPSGRERVHVQNIVSLVDFNARLKECRNSLMR